MLLGDAAGFGESKAFVLDSWLVVVVEISMLLVFATTSKIKMMKLGLFLHFSIS